MTINQKLILPSVSSSILPKTFGTSIVPPATRYASRGGTETPGRSSSLGTVIGNVALSIGLGIWLGVYGVTLATSLVAVGAIVAQVDPLGRTLGT